MKKKDFIGLSTLLLVLLLGLSTTSYADVYREFTKEDFKNIIFNSLTHNGKTGTEAEDIISTINDTDLESIATSLNSYDYCVVSASTTTLNIRAGNYNYTSGTNKTTYFTPNDSQIVNNQQNIYDYGVLVSVYGSLAGTVTWNNNYYIVNLERNNNSIGNNYFYTSYNTYRGTGASSGGGTANPVPYYYPDNNIFSGQYDPEPTPSHSEIVFTPIPKVQDVYVGQNLDIYTYGVNQNNTYRSMKFGDLYVPSGYYITRVDSTYLYFERASETWKEKILLQEVGTDLTLSNYSRTITNFKWENYDSSTYTIDYSAWINREYLHANCMYTFTFSGYYLDESDPFYIEYIFYIIDGNTVLSGTLGDELDPSFLISGPYADDYADDIDDLNDKVDENADLVDAIGQGLDGTLRPASGDWFPLNNLSSGDSLLGTAQLWGFRNYANGYWDSLYAVFSNTTYTLQQTGNVQLSVSFHGYTKVLNSNDFTTPSGDLKTFISSALVMGTMFAVYKLFSRKIEKIKRADLTDIKNEAKDDSDLM